MSNLQQPKLYKIGKKWKHTSIYIIERPQELAWNDDVSSDFLSKFEDQLFEPPRLPVTIDPELKLLRNWFGHPVVKFLRIESLWTVVFEEEKCLKMLEEVNSEIWLWIGFVVLETPLWILDFWWSPKKKKGFTN